jgi:Arc/MetJ family transcription regulator
MVKRTTIEIDEGLLSRAKEALGTKTTRATVEEALGRAADSSESATAIKARRQRDYLRGLPTMADMAVLASEEMWR